MLRIRNITLIIGLLTCLTITYSCANLKETKEVPHWSVDFTKGGCLDVCKAYHLQIGQDGTYDYKGIHNVKYLGKKSGKIHSDELIRLELLLTAIRWPDTDTTFGNPSEDSAGKTLSYLPNDERKTIQYYRGEPIEIRVLEKFMDKIIDRDDF